MVGTGRIEKEELKIQNFLKSITVRKLQSVYHEETLPKNPCSDKKRIRYKMP